MIAGLPFSAPPSGDALLDDGDGLCPMELGARPLGESGAGEAVDETKDLVRTWDGEHVIDRQRHAARAARGGTDARPCTRAVNGSVAPMRRATAEGTAETGDTDVAADVQCMADRYDYYRRRPAG